MPRLGCGNRDNSGIIYMPCKTENIDDDLIIDHRDNKVYTIFKSSLTIDSGDRMDSFRDFNEIETIHTMIGIMLEHRKEIDDG